MAETLDATRITRTIGRTSPVLRPRTLGFPALLALPKHSRVAVAHLWQSLTHFDALEQLPVTNALGSDM